MESLSVLILLFLSSFFSGSESALFSLRWWHIHYLVHRRGSAGRLVGWMMENPRRVLITILLGNTIVNVSASSIADNILERNLPRQGLWIAIIFMTFILLVFGEITPKIIAVQNPERFSLLFAKPLRFFMFILAPMRYVLEKISSFIQGRGRKEEDRKDSFGKDEFINLVKESVRVEIISQKEAQVVESILEMGEINLDKIMIPRTEMITLPETVSLEEAAEVFLKNDLRRIPLYRDSLDRITGILYAKDILRERLLTKSTKTAKTLARTPYFVPSCITLKQLFAEMKVKNFHQAIVLDEYGGTAGLIAHEDMLMSLFGGVLEKEDAPGEMIRRIDENKFIVDAGISLSKLAKKTGLNLAKSRFRTFNGFLIDRFGRIPEKGEKILLKKESRSDDLSSTSDWEVEILEIHLTRIIRVQIYRCDAREEVHP